jgi:Putative adhesin
MSTTDMGQAPPARQGTGRRGPVVAAALVGLALITLGAVSLIGLAIQRTERSTRSWSGVEAIEVEVGSGDVEVTAAGRGDVQVEQIERRSWRAPRTEARLSGGVLQLSARCRPAWFGNCEVDYRIQAPASTRVQARSSSGDLLATGLRSAVDLQTRSGNVQVREVVGPVSAATNSGNVAVRDSEGDVRARTSSGDVTGVDLVARSIEARSSSGDVRVAAVRTAPDALTAVTSSGDVRVIVPDETYRVDAHSSSGDVNLSLRQDPDAPRHIEARTSSGDVDVRSG